MSNGTPEFQIGLVMAGAISAGAYTAGVIDFLLEALAEWEKAKQQGVEPAPDHAARIRAVTGASAGAMTAAILARALASDVVPVRDPLAPPDPPALDPAQPRAFRNPLYGAWVQSIDIRHLLGGKDLEARSARVVSLLDSTVLLDIGGNALRATPRPRPAPYVAEPLDIFLTTTNLRGVPYGFRLAGAGASYRHMMTAYADHVHFLLAWDGATRPPADGSVLKAPELAPAGDWWNLMRAALASGAFPIGLAPVLLGRKAAEYDCRLRVPDEGLLWTVPTRPGQAAEPVAVELDAQRAVVCDPGDPRALQWLPAPMYPVVPEWPDGIRMAPDEPCARPDYEYVYRNVDGGLMNNEPLELARQALAGPRGRNPRGGLEADRGVVMIDPFPNESDVRAAYDSEIDLFGVIGRMFNALKEQARFKPEELALAAEDEVYSRFVIAPVYSHGGRVTEPAIASAVLGGFGGFLAESFRRHDFQLGRRNCQQFLRAHFVLPLANPLFAGWRDDPARRTRFAFPDPADPARRMAPIVPLVGTAAADVPLPARPRGTDVDLTELRRQVRAAARPGGAAPVRRASRRLAAAAGAARLVRGLDRRSARQDRRSDHRQDRGRPAPFALTAARRRSRGAGLPAATGVRNLYQYRLIQ